MDNLIGFKDFIYQNNLEFIQSQMLRNEKTLFSEGRTQLKGMYKEINLIESHKDKNEEINFKLDLKTHNNKVYKFELSPSDLKSIGLKSALKRISST
ncbi:hypothetical protein [Vibrio harveyi]|uniref:hypothetical protein n=1 Tax=Vibrio harveyi TaxID=669 RepID=UPI003CE6A177